MMDTREVTQVNAHAEAQRKVQQRKWNQAVREELMRYYIRRIEPGLVVLGIEK